MSKLEKQMALPRRVLFRNGEDAAAISVKGFRPKPPRKAKKVAKRKP